MDVGRIGFSCVNGIVHWKPVATATIEPETESLEAVIRRGLPPIAAPGLEPLALDVAEFSVGAIDVETFVSRVDLVGEGLWLGIVERMATAQGAELQALRASFAWLSRFPTWSPEWR